jgi:hypothetical protein
MWLEIAFLVSSSIWVFAASYFFFIPAFKRSIKPFLGAAYPAERLMDFGLAADSAFFGLAG